MREIRPFSRLRRVAPEVLVGLAVFVLVLTAAGTAGNAGFTGHGHFASTLSASLALSDRHAMLILLAGVLSLLSTLNLAFFRHLVRTYASPAPRKCHR